MEGSQTVIDVKEEVSSSEDSFVDISTKEDGSEEDVFELVLEKVKKKKYRDKIRYYIEEHAEDAIELMSLIIDGDLDTLIEVMRGKRSINNLDLQRSLLYEYYRKKSEEVISVKLSPCPECGNNSVRSRIVTTRATDEAITTIEVCETQGCKYRKRE